MFPEPAVADLLRAHYIEARLHTDDQTAPARSEEFKQLQHDMTGTISQPTYVILDPKTGKKLAQRSGSASVDTFVRFFREYASN